MHTSLNPSFWIARTSDLNLTLDSMNGSIPYMKRAFVGLMAFVALAGLINCVVIEPAHAHKDDKAVSSSAENSKCCSFCCSVHHQWLPSTLSVKAFTNLIAMLFIPAALSFAPDPPTGSIFHPPLAL